MKATKLIATVTALSLVFAGTAKVSMNDVSLSSTKGSVELAVESNEAVYGLQFDLKFFVDHFFLLNFPKNFQRQTYPNHPYKLVLIYNYQ